MESNRSIISKAAADTTALGTGGKLNAEQSNQFITFMQDYSPFLKNTNFIKMTKTTRDLDSLEVNKRALRRQTENADNPASGTAVHKRRTLNAVGVIMSYDVTTGGKNVSYDGFEIVPVAFIPDDVQIVTPYENLVYGIYGPSLEVYHQVKPRMTRHEYTLLADFDMEINNPDALVIGSKFTEGA